MKSIYNICYFILFVSFISCEKDNPQFLKNGYVDRCSYSPGDTAILYLSFNTTTKNEKITLCDINNIVVDYINCDLFKQNINNIEPYKFGFNYNPSYKYVIPDIKSGIYLWDKKVPILVKNKIKSSRIIIVYPSNTENAYDIEGGKSLYKDLNNLFENRANEVSFLRPAEISHYSLYFLKWFDNQSYSNYSYVSDMDMDDEDLLNSTKLLIIIGHSEYWTRKARLNFDKYFNNGGNVLILSGNTMWWQVRYNSDKNSLICYKSFSDTISNSLFKTVNWFEESLKYPIVESIAQDFQNGGGYGMKAENNFGWKGFKIVDPKNPIFENADVKFGDIISIPTVEYDGVPLFGERNDSIPKVNVRKTGFSIIKLLGYDYCSSNSTGTFIIGKKSSNSGILINVGSTDWCSINGLGGKDKNKVEIITKNMIDKLLSDDDLLNY